MVDIMNDANITFGQIVDADDASIYEARTKSPGPEGRLPLPRRRYSDRRAGISSGTA